MDALKRFGFTPEDGAGLVCEAYAEEEISVFVMGEGFRVLERRKLGDADAVTSVNSLTCRRCAEAVRFHTRGWGRAGLRGVCREAYLCSPWAGDLACWSGSSWAC